jgi:MFS superfamily sulfate permease-like transporter
LAAFVGGLPMISEIVRSRANIDNGAHTRFADLFHSLFLLACVALIPFVLHLIPLAASAAMLIYTGFRLAYLREVMQVFKVGPEQFLIFTSTIVGVLATDLLVGIAIGIAVKFCIHPPGQRRAGPVAVQVLRGSCPGGRHGLPHQRLALGGV